MFEKCPLCRSCGSVIFHEGEDADGVFRRYWQCPECALVFIDRTALPPVTEERSRYDLHCNSPEDEGYVRFLSRLTGPLVARLPRPAEGLDYGCGPGPAVSRILAREGWRVADYDPLYFPDTSLLERTYDFITCTEAVEHFHYPWKDFEQLDAMLARGGILAVMTGVLEDAENFASWWYRRDPTHVTFYRPRTFESIARWKGWELERPHPNVVFFTKP